MALILHFKDSSREIKIPFINYDEIRLFLISEIIKQKNWNHLDLETQKIIAMKIHIFDFPKAINLFCKKVPTFIFEVKEDLDMYLFPKVTTEEIQEKLEKIVFASFLIQ